jgi:PBSX family phage terminase large subunit
MKLDELKLIELSDDGYKVYACPLCGGHIKVHESVFYGRCDSCLATLIDYKPAPHQVKFHESKAKFRLNIGGFGSGKTTMDAAEVACHALSVANGRTLITAQSLQQVKEAVLPELERFLPPWFFAKAPTKTPLPKYTLTNGHEIIVYASNDEEKLRSLNLTAFWIVEASGVSYDIFTQLTARLRNRAAIVKDRTGKEIEHRFMGIVESNPEDGWIRDEFLIRSDKIFASKNVDTSSYDKLKVEKPEKAYHSFLSASPDNKYLHDNFIRDMCVGKDDRWIRKYVYCYLEVKEGAVYPDFKDCLVDPFPIPDNWLRIFGFDKGWTDETCLCCGAIDAQKGICYIYDEYYMSEKPITYHARRIKEKVMGLPLYKNIMADPSVRNKNDRDGVSYRDYFYNVSGLWLEEANNTIFDGIERVRDFMYQGKLKVFVSCVNLKQEAQKYQWKKGKDGISKDEPVDKQNHLMDALRYLVMALPNDMKEINLVRANEISKETALSRLKMIDDDDSKYPEDGVGGVYGLGYYDM